MPRQQCFRSGDGGNLCEELSPELLRLRRQATSLIVIEPQTVIPNLFAQSPNVQWDALHIRILDPRTHQLLREHVRQERGWHRIRPEDNPKKTPLTTAQLLARPGRAESHIGAFCEAIHHHQGETGIRRILGRAVSGEEVRRACC